MNTDLMMKQEGDERSETAIKQGGEEDTEGGERSETAKNLKKLKTSKNQHRLNKYHKL